MTAACRSFSDHGCYVDDEGGISIVTEIGPGRASSITGGGTYRIGKSK